MVATMARRRQQRSINAKYDPLMRNTRSSSALFSVKRDPDPYPSQTRAGSAASRAALLEVLGLPEFAVSAGAGGGRSERQLRRQAGPYGVSLAALPSLAAPKSSLTKRSQDLIQKLFRNGDAGYQDIQLEGRNALNLAVEAQNFDFAVPPLHRPAHSHAYRAVQRLPPPNKCAYGIETSRGHVSERDAGDYTHAAYDGYDVYDVDVYEEEEDTYGYEYYKQPRAPRYAPNVYDRDRDIYHPYPRDEAVFGYGTRPARLFRPRSRDAYPGDPRVTKRYHPYGYRGPSPSTPTRRRVRAPIIEYYEHAEALYEHSPISRPPPQAQVRRAAYIEEPGSSPPREPHTSHCACPACPAHAPRQERDGTRPRSLTSVVPLHAQAHARRSLEEIMPVEEGDGGVPAVVEQLTRAPLAVSEAEGKAQQPVRIFFLSASPPSAHASHSQPIKSSESRAPAPLPRLPRPPSPPLLSSSSSTHENEASTFSPVPTVSHSEYEYESPSSDSVKAYRPRKPTNTKAKASSKDTAGKQPTPTKVHEQPQVAPPPASQAPWAQAAIAVTILEHAVASPVSSDDPLLKSAPRKVAPQKESSRVQARWGTSPLNEDTDVQDQISGNHSSGAGHRNSDIGVEHPHPPSVDEYDDFDSAFDDDFLQQIQLPGVRLSEEYEPLPHPSIQLQSQSPQPQPPQSQSQPRQPRRPSDRAWALTGIFRRPAHSPAPSPSPLPSMFPRPAATSAGVNTLEDDVESISAFSDGEERSYEYDSAARGRAGLFNATHENENEYQEAEVEDSIDEPDPTPPPPTKPRKRVRWADQQPRFADPGFTIWRDEY